MSKSSITTFVSLLLCIIGYYLPQPLILSAGLFAFSGALTNWLAIHMLFEKVPLIYGSGVIPARFDDFKHAIKTMMMNEFFTKQNIEQFLAKSEPEPVNLEPVINRIDFAPAFDSLVKVIMNSSFGSMIGVFGGAEALQPLKEPFMHKMHSSLIELSNTPSVQEAIHEQIAQQADEQKIQQKIETIIDNRLDELTPELVKQLVQNIIRQHLGWLVVWGGVFGGLIGIATTFIPS